MQPNNHGTCVGWLSLWDWAYTLTSNIMNCYQYLLVFTVGCRMELCCTEIMYAKYWNLLRFWKFFFLAIVYFSGNRKVCLAGQLEKEKKRRKKGMKENVNQDGIVYCGFNCLILDLRTCWSVRMFDWPWLPLEGLAITAWSIFLKSWEYIYIYIYIYMFYSS